MRAAMAALPFEKPKLAAVMQVGKEDSAEALHRAIERSEKARELQQQKVIEHKQVVEESLPDHSKPLAQNSKHRFRRI